MLKQAQHEKKKIIKPIRWLCLSESIIRLLWASKASWPRRKWSIEPFPSQLTIFKINFANWKRDSPEKFTFYVNSLRAYLIGTTSWQYCIEFWLTEKKTKFNWQFKIDRCLDDDNNKKTRENVVRFRSIDFNRLKMKSKFLLIDKKFIISKRLSKVDSINHYFSEQSGRRTDKWKGWSSE